MAEPSTGTIPLDRQVTLGEDALPGEARIIHAAERALTGERRGVRAVLPFLGPAFTALIIGLNVYLLVSA